MGALLSKHPDPARLWIKLARLGWTAADLAKQAKVPDKSVGRALTGWPIPVDDLEAITRAVARAEAP